MTKYQELCARAETLSAKTRDAYSYERYAHWTAVALMLLRRGYSDEQAEVILRSKITRWASDMSEARYGRVTAKDVARYIDRFPGDMTFILRD